MSPSTGTFRRRATTELYQLIVRAKAIAAQIEASTDDDEIASLCGDLLQLNNHIIRAPVASLDDVQRKAAYLLASGDPLDAGTIEPLLRSLVGEVPA